MGSPGRADAPARGSGRTVLSGSLWSTTAQVTPLVVNLLLTPYIIAGFGLERYGLYMLLVALTTFLASFDGGLSASAARYLAIAVGGGDRRAASRLVLSLTLVVVLASVLVSLTLFSVAPVVIDLFGVPARLRGEGVFLLRTLGVVTGFAVLRGLFAAVLVAHQRFALISLTQTALYSVYVVGLVLSVERGYGLRGIAVTAALQQALNSAVVIPSALRLLSRSGFGLWSLAEYREFFGYSLRVQLVGISTLVNQQADALVIGALLPLAKVGVYAAGASFANQLRTVPHNALAPLQVVLGRTLGQEGEQALLERFRSLQRYWVIGTTGWCAVGVPAALVGVPVWLGPELQEAGQVAALLVAGHLVHLGVGLLTQYLSVVGRPGLEARYALVSMALNLTLTVPLALLGVLGVVTATVLGQALGSLYLLRVVRRRLSPELPSFLREVPWPAVLVALAVTGAGELLVVQVAPRGALGLLLCGLPALVGLLVFLPVALGRAEAAAVLALVRARLAGRRAAAPLNSAAVRSEEGEDTHQQ